MLLVYNERNYDEIRLKTPRVERWFDRRLRRRLHGYLPKIVKDA